MTILDIVNKVYFLTKTNSSSYLAADMLFSINNAAERVASLILAQDSRWQWDDSNQTDLPISTQNLASGQQDYSHSATHLTVDRLEIKDASGTWQKLTQIDQQKLKRDRKVALGNYQTTAGTPTEYDLVAQSIFLYPAPSYNSTGGLKIYFTRGPAAFTSAEVSTGTKLPGFNSLFHDLIPLWVAHDYALANGTGNVNAIFNQIQVKEQQIKDFYGLRNRDERPRLTVSDDTNK